MQFFCIPTSNYTHLTKMARCFSLLVLFLFPLCFFCLSHVLNFELVISMHQNLSPPQQLVINDLIQVQLPRTYVLARKQETAMDGDEPNDRSCGVKKAKKVPT